MTAQGFTTGGSTGGYTLSDIEAVVGAANATQRATIRTELWSATSAGAPKAKLADLTVPSTVSAGTVSFAAPQGTMLSASTKYFLLFYTDGSFAWQVSMTASNSEDSSGQADWGIENGSRYTTGANSDTPTGATWAEDNTQNVRIRVNGSTAGAAAPDAPTGLTVTPGDAELTVSWTAPSGTVTGYDVHYTSNTTVAAGAAVQAVSAAAGWLAHPTRTATDTSTSQTISSLMNGTPYRVRVRAKNTNGDSAWVTVSGTPAPALVSNTGQTPFGSNVSLSALSLAQGFTTGSNADGYTLEDIGVKLAIGAGFTAADRGTIRAELWSGNSDGTPNAKTADLTVPSSMATGTVAFAAPAGTTLTANTAYHFVIYSTGSLANAKLNIPYTASDDEDSGAATGWSIADAWYHQARDVPQAQQAWTAGTSALQIRVNGSAVAPTLVSNDGQTSFAANTNLTTQSRAQAFTTGSNADGYTLEGIGIKLFVYSTFTDADRGTIRAELWSSNSDGTPNAKTVDLTVPSSMATGTVVFGAPVGTALAADTAYHFVLYSTGDLAAAKLEVAFTTADNEDGGAATGWSIANAFYSQTGNVPQAQGTWTPDSSGSALQISVKGTAVEGQDPPTDLAVTPGDAQLTMSWTPPSNAPDGISGYDMAFTSAAVGDVADDAASSGGDPAVAWVATSQINYTATSFAIDSDEATLTNGVTYRVRLRTVGPDSAYVYSSGTPSASAATAIWSATLTAQRIVSSFRGCDNTGAGAVKCSAAATLTDDDFTLSSTTWEITGIQSDGSRMTVFFNQDVQTALDSYSFCVGATAFAFSDATHGGGNDSARWTTGVPTWTTGDVVALSINSASCAQQAVQAPPTDLTVTPGDAQLTVSWTAPSNAPNGISGYDLEITSAAVGDVADDAVATGSNSAAAWIVASNPRDTATSYTIDSSVRPLVNGTTYRVRLRTVSPDSAWVYSSGTPTAAVTLVSNFGQQQGANYGSNGWVNAQAFTTGSNAAGYTLSAIEALLERAWADSTERGTVRAELWSAASGGAPDQKLADLTVPASHVATAMSFAAPANTALTANTAYFLVLYTTGTYNMGIDHVLATGEDSGAAAGWSIADDRYAKQSQTPAGAAAWGSHSNPLRITVKGTAAQTALFSANANLSGLTASTATSSGGPYSALTIGAFMASTQSYTATVANARTHLTLTPTVADTGKATVGVRKGNAGSFTPVADGTASSAIALDLGSNAITVRVTAEDRKTTRDYTVTVTRQTQAALPAVTLSASPNPVSEGAGVTVTARLSEALSSMVTIPLTITDNTAEPEDHGTVTGILINAGATSGTGTITTSQDPDEDDETFTVALGTLPATVEAGTPDRVLIRILDDDRDAPDFTELAGLTGSASTDGADFGGTLTLEPAFDPRTVEYTARVAAAATHVRLTAAADFAAYDVVAVNTRTVEGVYASSTTLTAASPSADFALDAGTTNLRLVVDDKAAVLSTRSYNVSVVGGTTPRDPGGGIGGGGGGGGAPRDPVDDAPANRAPETAAEIAAPTLRAGADVEIDLSDAFDDPDGDALEYAAESSDESVATVEIDGDTLTVRGLGRGAAEITVTAEDADGDRVSQTFEVTVTAPETAWYLPPVADAVRQGFVRVLNHSDVAGEASITATDDAGVAYEPLTLTLGARAVAAFNSDDLEAGNAAKGLTGATGMGTGGWRLEIESETLDIEALAYIRTTDGFVTGMNAVAPREDGALAIPTFNPGSNVDQVSKLRLVNPGTEEAKATVTGTDDAGLSPGSPVRLTLPAGSSCTVDAAQLESGSGLACGTPQDGLGDGSGKWRLAVASDARLVALSLLSSPAGHLTNLSGKAAADAEDMWHVDLLPAASDPLGRQGFVRVVNRSAVAGAVTITAHDDSDTPYETLRLALDAGETAHFNSDDLELGNAAKGLTGSTGSGMGAWRLVLSSGLDIEANAYIRTTEGFLTAMNAAAPAADAVRRVAFFNPGSNADQVSVLRLVNRSSGEAEVSLDGTDDLGLRPGTTVRILVPATDAVELTAAELESGEADAIESGALGDGTGKWRLRVESMRLGAVQSLLSSPSGHLTNLSHADGERGLGELPAALLPAPAPVTLERAGDSHIQGRWSAVAGARYDVDLLRDGVRQEDRSLTRARSTSFRWLTTRAGTYAIRVRSVNEDRVPGPWSAVSDEVVID